MFGVTFYLSLVAFIISIASGIYFFAWWLTSGRRHSLLLYWAYGLGSLLLFKIPNILANARVEISQENFYPFFFVTLLLYFLAYFSFLQGLDFFIQSAPSKSIRGLFTAWFGVAVIYFALSFFVESPDGVIFPVWVGHVLFYIPAQIYLLYKLCRLEKNSEEQIVISQIGVHLAVLGVFVLLLTSVFYIFVQVWPYSQRFWYLSVISSPNISILQIISGLFLFFGFRIIAKSYLRASR